LEDLKKVISLCEKNSWVKPSVYQGMYNVINRSSENKLFPILRKNNISFYGYSPIAAGIFTMKEDEEVASGSIQTVEGHLNSIEDYTGMRKPSKFSGP